MGRVPVDPSVDSTPPRTRTTTFTASILRSGPVRRIPVDRGTPLPEVSGRELGFPGPAPPANVEGCSDLSRVWERERDRPQVLRRMRWPARPGLPLLR